MANVLNPILDHKYIDNKQEVNKFYDGYINSQDKNIDEFDGTGKSTTNFNINNIEIKLNDTFSPSGTNKDLLKLFQFYLNNININQNPGAEIIDKLNTNYAEEILTQISAEPKNKVAIFKYKVYLYNINNYLNSFVNKNNADFNSIKSEIDVFKLLLDNVIQNIRNEYFSNIRNLILPKSSDNPLKQVVDATYEFMDMYIPKLLNVKSIDLSKEDLSEEDLSSSPSDVSGEDFDVFEGITNLGGGALETPTQPFSIKTLKDLKTIQNDNKFKSTNTKKIRSNFTDGWSSILNSNKNKYYGFNEDVPTIRGNSPEYSLSNQANSNIIQQYINKCVDLQIFYLKKHIELYDIFKLMKKYIDLNISINDIIKGLLDPKYYNKYKGNKITIKLPAILKEIDQKLNKEKDITKSLTKQYNLFGENSNLQGGANANPSDSVTNDNLALNLTSGLANAINRSSKEFKILKKDFDPILKVSNKSQVNIPIKEGQTFHLSFTINDNINPTFMMTLKKISDDENTYIFHNILSNTDNPIKVLSELLNGEQSVEIKIVDYVIDSIESYEILQAIKRIQLLNEQSLSAIVGIKDVNNKDTLDKILDEYKANIDGDGDGNKNKNGYNYIKDLIPKNNSGDLWQNFNTSNTKATHFDINAINDISDTNQSGIETINSTEIQSAIYKCYDLQILYLVKHLEIIEMFKLVFYFFDMLLKKIGVLFFILSLYKRYKIDLNDMPKSINIKDFIKNMPNILNLHAKIEQNIMGGGANNILVDQSNIANPIEGQTKIANPIEGQSNIANPLVTNTELPNQNNNRLSTNVQLLTKKTNNLLRKIKQNENKTKNTILSIKNNSPITYLKELAYNKYEENIDKITTKRIANIQKNPGNNKQTRLLQTILLEKLNEIAPTENDSDNKIIQIFNILLDYFKTIKDESDNPNNPNNPNNLPNFTQPYNYIDKLLIEILQKYLVVVMEIIKNKQNTSQSSNSKDKSVNILNNIFYDLEEYLVNINISRNSIRKKRSSYGVVKIGQFSKDDLVSTDKILKSFHGTFREKYKKDLEIDKISNTEINFPHKYNEEYKNINELKTKIQQLQKTNAPNKAIDEKILELSNVYMKVFNNLGLQYIANSINANSNFNELDIPTDIDLPNTSVQQYKLSYLELLHKTYLSNDKNFKILSGSEKSTTALSKGGKKDELEQQLLINLIQILKYKDLKIKFNLNLSLYITKNAYQYLSKKFEEYATNLTENQKNYNTTNQMQDVSKIYEEMNKITSVKNSEPITQTNEKANIQENIIQNIQENPKTLQIDPIIKNSQVEEENKILFTQPHISITNQNLQSLKPQINSTKRKEYIPTYNERWKELMEKKKQRNEKFDKDKKTRNEIFNKKREEIKRKFEEKRKQKNPQTLQIETQIAKNTSIPVNNTDSNQIMNVGNTQEESISILDQKQANNELIKQLEKPIEMPILNNNSKTYEFGEDRNYVVPIDTPSKFNEDADHKAHMEKLKQTELERQKLANAQKKEKEEQERLEREEEAALEKQKASNLERQRLEKQKQQNKETKKINNFFKKGEEENEIILKRELEKQQLENLEKTPQTSSINNIKQNLNKSALRVKERRKAEIEKKRLQNAEELENAIKNYNALEISDIEKENKKQILINLKKQQERERQNEEIELKELENQNQNVNIVEGGYYKSKLISGDKINKNKNKHTNNNQNQNHNYIQILSNLTKQKGKNKKRFASIKNNSNKLQKKGLFIKRTKKNIK